MDSGWEMWDVQEKTYNVLWLGFNTERNGFSTIALIRELCSFWNKCEFWMFSSSYIIWVGYLFKIFGFSTFKSFWEWYLRMTIWIWVGLVWDLLYPCAEIPLHIKVLAWIWELKIERTVLDVYWRKVTVPLNMCGNRLNK